MTTSKQSSFFILFLCVTLTTLAQSSAAPEWTKKVGARSFPSGKTIYYVNSYGAVSDTLTVNTKAIQSAIDACAAKGGGIVAFKPGTYVTGAIFLKSNVHLRIDKGVLILGSQNFDDYPDMD